MGKSASMILPRVFREKHPHGRGEETASDVVTALSEETPPRAWGRVVQNLNQNRRPGNTPTGVGKSRAGLFGKPNTWKHPHGRGEETASIKSCTTCAETPPRAWGRAAIIHLILKMDRNTPTGVGKRSSRYSGAHYTEKHPHGRGEEILCAVSSAIKQETPPRAWGRVCAGRYRAGHCGNTPTGVGKSAHSNFKQFEYYSIFFSFVKEPGSVCADFSIISCSPDMDVKSFVGMPFA